MLRSGLESKNHHGSSRSKGTGRHFGSVQIVGHILAFVLPPQIRTLRQWRDFEQRDKLVREGEIWENVFNPGLMHKLIV